MNILVKFVTKEGIRPAAVQDSQKKNLLDPKNGLSEPFGPLCYLE